MALALDIEYLATDHAVDSSYRIGDKTDDLDGSSWRCVESGQDLERASLQSVSGEDGNGFAECHVAGGLTATQVVVIERGQIVVDERIGVQHFDGCAESLNAARQRTGNGNRGLHGKNRTQPLATSKDGVAHGAVDRRRDSVDRWDKCFQRAIGELRAFLDHRFNVNWHSSL